MKIRLAALLGAVALLGMFAIPSAAATTYYGPSFAVTPSSITPGQTVNIQLSTTSGTSFTAPPSGGGGTVYCTGTGSTCYFALESCPTGLFQYYSIHQVSVTDPVGNVYWLGGSSGYSLSWPTWLGGPAGGYQTTIDGFGPAVNVSQTDSFTIPFGQGVGGFTLTTSLGSPTVNPEGPYYWYQQGGSGPISPSFNPTTQHGTYTVDIEGAVVCGTPTDESVTSFSIAPIFFDGAVQFNTPQFAVAPVAATVAIAFLGLVLLKKKNAIAPHV